MQLYRSQYQQMDLGCCLAGACMCRCQQLEKLGSKDHLLQGSMSCLCMHFPPMDLHPELIERKGRIRQSVFAWVNMCGCPYICIYCVCARVPMRNMCYWLNQRTWSCCNSVSIRLLDSVAPNKSDQHHMCTENRQFIHLLRHWYITYMFQVCLHG